MYYCDYCQKYHGMHSQVQVQVRDAPIDIEHAMAETKEHNKKYSIEYAARSELVLPRTNPMGPRVERIMRRGSGFGYNPVPRGNLIRKNHR